jgi:pimeloyl-ACP methyl ester carboxylesterase
MAAFGRHVLPAIRTPTLILHRIGDARVTVDAIRYVAAHIPDARMVELPGVNHNFFGERNVADRVRSETPILRLDMIQIRDHNTGAAISEGMLPRHFDT